jgi:hypothetical protein
MTLRSASCKKGIPIEVQSKLGHTWGSTGVSSIGITSGSLSLTFSATTARWTGVLNPAVNWYPFGK